MKKVFVIAALLCCSMLSFGQSKGDMTLNANINFNLDKSYRGNLNTPVSTSFGISAGTSYFVIDNLSVGLGLGYNLYGGSSQFSITPSVAYYIGIVDNLYYRPTLGYSISFDKNDTIHDINLSAGAFEYRILDHFAVVANLLNFRFMTQSKVDYQSIGLSLSIPSFGVIFYL